MNQCGPTSTMWRLDRLVRFRIEMESSMLWPQAILEFCTARVGDFHVLIAYWSLWSEVNSLLLACSEECWQVVVELSVLVTDHTNIQVGHAIF